MALRFVDVSCPILWQVRTNQHCKDCKVILGMSEQEESPHSYRESSQTHKSRMRCSLMMWKHPRRSVIVTVNGLTLTLFSLLEAELSRYRYGLDLLGPQRSLQP